MRNARPWLAALCLVILLAPAALGQAKATNTAVPDIDIPYSKHVLSNGLTLIHHEDRKAPIVAVNIWYHVGSKNEKPGKTGFAHLFEHLVFNGSENFNDDYFKVLETLGATDLNGTTNNDRTNYFQNVPKSALDTVLWLESDRMGHLLGAINQAKLDEQRGVVQNEKRQSDNEPYGISEELITKAVYPSHHPYSHTVIGSLEDLDAASLEDVKAWFREYYGAANAVVVVAGDIDFATARAKVEQFFGDIPAGPPVSKYASWPAPRTSPTRQTAHDRVAQARLYKVWNVPGYGETDETLLSLITDLLVSDKKSRLYKRLMYDDQTATQVSAYIDQREIGSLFTVEITARPGDDLTKVEKAFDEELARLLTSGPTQAELDRVKTAYFAGFVRGAERIGGFGGKSDILATGQVFGGSPDAYKRVLNDVRKATIADIQRAGKQWLSQDGVYTLEIHPYPEYKTAATAVDRKKMPEAGAAPNPVFPELKTATLSNGVKLMVAERRNVPVVNLNLVVDAGYAGDKAVRPGTAALALNMMDEGTKTRNSLDISSDLTAIGATLGTGSNLDQSNVALSTLSTTLDQALNIWADVILNPSFPADDFARLKKFQLAAIQREKAQPIQMALRVLPGLLYGNDHAYGIPLTGSGTEESVAALTREDLMKFHATWFKPNNASILVVGDTSLAEIQPKLEKLFAGWKRGDVPAKNVSTVQMPQKPTVYLIDKPGAVQSVIFAGILAPPKSDPDDIAIETMNTVLGGQFIARLNMNLREDKHWSYGSYSFINATSAQRPFIAYAPVQTDKTKESVAEIAKELRAITKDRVVTADEMATAKSALTLSLPGSWETANDVMGSMNQIVRYGLPMDYFTTYAGRVKGITLTETNRAAVKVVRPENLTWVIVGDRSKIEEGIRSLNLGEIRRIDVDGNPVK